MTACIVAIPAEQVQDSDAGVNAYPVIKDATPTMPGPLTINTGSPQDVTLTLSDSDKGDDLFVRVFIDYPTKLGNFQFTVRNDAQAGVEDRRPLVISTMGWCDTLSQTTSHVVDVVVADRPYNDSPNTPIPLKTPTAPGKTSTRSWLIQCKSP